MAQGAAEMVEHALVAEGATVKVLRPVLLRAEHADLQSEEFVEELRRMAETIGASRGAAAKPAQAIFRAAHEAALASQRRFEDGLRAIGERALAWAREEGRPAVLIAGETHVLHEPVINSGIQELVAANGAVPVPADCYPLPQGVPPLARVHWASAGSALRAAVAGVQAGGVYPLLLCAYGCGPNSFVEHLFDHLLEDYPHTVLESDGHGGKAGYVTRVQAFLHTVRAYEAERAAGPPAAADGPAAAQGPAAGRAAGRIGAQRLARYETPLPSSLDGGGYRRYYFGHVGGSLGRQLVAAMRGSGLDAHYAGPADELALEEAGRHCTGKECLPYQLIWGSFARFLQAEPAGAGDEAPNGHGRTLFLSAGNGFQACRANCFPLAEQIALDKLGLGERIEVGDLGLVTGSRKMMPVAWSALVAVDLLNMMRFYHLATERTRGDADALFARHSDRLTSLLERPRRAAGLARGVAAARRTLREVEALVGQAAADFAGLPRDSAREAELRDVFICGDFFLRVDEWGNDQLQRKLSDLGLRLLFEPFGEFIELLVLRDVQEAVTDGRAAVERRATLRVMRYVIDRLVRTVQVHEPWVFWHDIRSVEGESRALLDGYPFGESIPTIGSALLTWRTKPVDGLVVVAPRGCGPALVAEAQLRRLAADGPPLLFVYNDGDPIDEDRLAGFAWRLRSRERRHSALLGVRST
jgi:predicted nucleotide-binding protein (sugar kinase/HSP70/actin superfamily)